jgi:hypothetical protein
MNDIYKILGIAEEHWKQLDEDYLEIVKNFLAGDLAQALNKEEQESLQKAVEGKTDVMQSLKDWAKENPEIGSKVGNKLKESWLASTLKFFGALMKDATPEQKQAVISFLGKKE